MLIGFFVCVGLFTACGDAERVPSDATKVEQAEEVKSDIRGYFTNIEFVERQGLPYTLTNEEEANQYTSKYLRFNFNVENVSGKPIGAKDSTGMMNSKGLNYVLEASDNMVATVTDIFGTDIFNEEGSELGMGGFQLTPYLEDGEVSENYVEFYVGTYDAEDKGLSVPSEDELATILEVASEGEMVVRVGGKELTRITK